MPAALLFCLSGSTLHAQQPDPVTPEASSADTAAGDDSQPEAPQPEPETREQLLLERVAELERKLESLSNQMESDSIERMIQDAQNEARSARDEPRPEQREFLAGGLALQKLNPEITFSADFMAGLVIDDGRFYAGEGDRSGLPVREVGLHIQHMLDPYSSFKSAFHIDPHHGLELEEVYISWFGVIPSLSLSVGRFRQNFGVLNRWHEHDLDQTQYPMALELVLGEEGLSGDGFMLRWMLPALWAHANEITLEVVDGSNPTLFSGEHFSVPSSLLHLKNYYDLSDSTYLEFGLTGMFGFNNRRGLIDDNQQLVDEPWRRSLVLGADLTVNWTPTQQARYRSLTWRSEFFYTNIERGPDAPEDFSQSWGMYSYLQYQLSARWFVGLRGDVAVPTERVSDDIAWGVVPYVTLWQSEFVYLRLEYRHGQNIPYTTPADTLGRRTDNRVLLQIDFAAGPHKHEKY